MYLQVRVTDLRWSTHTVKSIICLLKVINTANQLITQTNKYNSTSSGILKIKHRLVYY